MRFSMPVLLLAVVPLLTGHAWAANLILDLDGKPVPLSTATLLADSALKQIDVTHDVAYQRGMRFRAVPLKSLLTGIDRDCFDRLEAVALDGFVAQLPLSLLLDDRPDAAQPWLAIESPDAPWPPLPGKSVSAGPFYLVWLPGDGVGGELWPYQIVELSAVASPLKRWPELSPAADLPADSPAWHGAEVFSMQCLACHRLNGGGASTIGPDLNRPRNPFEYFQSDALRQLIRDPASVRHWPEQRMPAFPESSLSDADLDALLAYLRQMLAQRKADATP